MLIKEWPVENLLFLFFWIYYIEKIYKILLFKYELLS